MKKLNYVINLIMLTVLFLACSDDETPPPEPPGAYENGYFVSNEGPFQNGSGTITFVGDDGQVVQNVYSKENNEDLGNIVNSMEIVGDLAYIVVNNSGKLVVVDKNTMEKITIIEGDEIENPRYFVADNGIGYLSNWGDPLDSTDDFITVIDLSTQTIVRTIGVGEGPEKMLVSGDYLYVCLKGGYNFNNQVVAINLNALSVEENITVGDVPNSLVADSNGDIWVLCEGVPSWTNAETIGTLYTIDKNNFDVSNFSFDMGDHPVLLNIELNDMYYHLNGQVYKMNIQDSELPEQSVSGIAGSFYTMEVNQGELYTTNAGDFASEGTLKVFDLVTGTSSNTISTGIIPGDIVFP